MSWVALVILYRHTAMSSPGTGKPTLPIDLDLHFADLRAEAFVSPEHLIGYAFGSIK